MPSTEVDELLQTPRGQVHMLGVCGVGMAGLAYLLKSHGLAVSGCDGTPGGRMRDWLRREGIEVQDGHHPSHITPDVRWMIRSAAVPDNSPELTAARDAGLPVHRRGEVLPHLLSGYRSIAVCGSHGKTTTAWFIVQMLIRACLPVTWCIGGELPPSARHIAPDALGRPTRLGVAGSSGPQASQSTILVIEADESDGTLALYEPDMAVVTNVEFDHMEHFASREAFEVCFRRVIEQTRGTVVFCVDDPVTLRLFGECRTSVRPLTCGFGEDASLRGRDLSLAADSSAVRVEHRRAALGELRLPAPGKHNALNALAAFAVGLSLDLDVEQIRDGLSDVRLPRRRFEKTVDTDELVVISDYAHHPSEIAALIGAARRLGRRRTFAVFQPHRFSRTKALGLDFPAAFGGIDGLILLPVYAASEASVRGGTVWDLYRHFRDPTSLGLRRARGQDSPVIGAEGAERGCGGGVPIPMVAASLDEAWRYLQRSFTTGDLLLVVGAGDVERIAHWAADWHGARAPSAPRGETDPANPVDPVGRPSSAARLERVAPRSRFRSDEPLASKTTLQVGGSADVWAEIGSSEDLSAILHVTREQGVAFHVLSGGSNVLVSDLGVRGVIARLTGEDFHSIREADGLVVAGAGVSLAKLQGWLQEHGWSGLEFLEGVPGTIGGAVHMNAGAGGREIGERLAWIRAFNSDGSECIVPRTRLELGYRRCGAAQSRVVVEAGLMMERSDPDPIGRTRAANARRRVWMKGLRSAGSVFRNPPGDKAGRLLEEAGLKGVRIGGADVSRRHANVIVTHPGATASDVRGLIELARVEVRERFGVQLETEIQFL